VTDADYNDKNNGDGGCGDIGQNINYMIYDNYIELYHQVYCTNLELSYIMKIEKTTKLLDMMMTDHHNHVIILIVLKKLNQFLLNLVKLNKNYLISLSSIN